MSGLCVGVSGSRLGWLAAKCVLLPGPEQQHRTSHVMKKNPFQRDHHNCKSTLHHSHPSYLAWPLHHLILAVQSFGLGPRAVQYDQVVTRSSGTTGRRGRVP